MEATSSGVVTLSERASQLQEDRRLTPARRRDLISAVRRMCELTGVDPRITPASLRIMRPLITKVRPARYDMSPKTWSNVRSNFRAALVRSRPQVPIQADIEWERLRTALPNKTMKTGLSRFIGFCVREGISPGLVSDAVMARFLGYLEADTMVAQPRDVHRKACRLWNEASDRVPSWPTRRVVLPNYRKPAGTPPLASYPESLNRDLALYLDSLARPDRFDQSEPREPFRASTIAVMRTEFRLALGALVHSGIKPASITTLICLCTPEAFVTILRRYLDRNGNPRPSAHRLAATLIGLAKRRLGSDPAQIERLNELRRLRGCLGSQPKGLTTKNRTLLRALDVTEVRAKLLLLPERLSRWADQTGPKQGAIVMRSAVAIAILQSAPIRISNLAELRIDRHMSRPGGLKALWYIDVQSHRVKNKVHLTYELPQRVTDLVDRYIQRFRPILATPGNPYLFPVDSEHKHPHPFSRQLRWIIAIGSASI